MTSAWQKLGGSFAWKAFAAVAALGMVGLVHTPAFAQKLTSQQILENAFEGDAAKSKEVQAAIDDFYAGKFEESRKALEAIKKANAAMPPGDQMFAQLMLSAGQIGRARALLEKAVLDFPEDPEPLLFFGDLAFREAQVTDAGLLFAKAHDLAMKFKGNDRRKTSMQHRSLSGLSAVAEAREQWDQSEKLLREALTLDAENSGYKNRLARAVFQKKTDAAFKEAYDLLTAVYEKDKNGERKPLRPEISMGLLFEQAAVADATFHGKAQALMLKAAERDKDNAETLLQVARWALESNELPEAKKQAQAVLTKNPNSIDASLILGVLARYAKNYAEAEKMFTGVQAQSPANMSAVANLALVLIEMPDEAKRKRALEFAQLFARTNNDVSTPNGREAVVTLAWVLFKSGDEANAEKALQAAISAGGLTSDTAYFAAEIIAKRGNKELAVQLLDAALANTRPFPTKQDASALLAKLKGAPASAPPTNPAPKK